MIFQDPFACLHPMYRVGDQIAEAVTAHFDVARRPRRRNARSSCSNAVGIPSASQRARDYPHQFSGGMRQRAMIAMALVNNPSLLIADEPTTALDVTVQAQILELIDEVKRDFDIGVILVTHDLGVVSETADRPRHVRGPRPRARAGAGDLRSSAAPLHVGPARARCRRSRPARVARPDRGSAARRWSHPRAGARSHPRCRYALRAVCDEEFPSPLPAASRPVRATSWRRRSGGPSATRSGQGWEP